VYFNPTAQAVSNTPAKTRITHGMRASLYLIR
jgi:hypothetical protein